MHLSYLKQLELETNRQLPQTLIDLLLLLFFFFFLSSVAASDRGF